MKKLTVLFLSLIFFLAFNSVFTISSSKLKINNISTWFRNNGSFNREPATGNAGFEWPKGTGKTARYASGIWLGCISGPETLTAVSEYAYDYNPGYIDNNGNPQGGNDSTYRVYNIYRNDTNNYDYSHWPVNQGAYTDYRGKPLLLGSQTQFLTFHDGYGHFQGGTSVNPLKVQILNTNWAYDSAGHLGNSIFSEFKIINRSNNVWNNLYFAFWIDDDLGNATDDAVGCDTLRDLGYTYNYTNNDPVYGISPPAIGTVFLRGPLQFTGNINDTVRYYDPPGTNHITKKIGYKQLGLIAHNHYNGTSPQPSDPGSNKEYYRVIEGKWKTGVSWINPVNNMVTKYAYSGDPVTGSGWNMAGGTDRRNLISSGPVTINPGDTQSIIIAQVIAKGSSNLNSITKLREAVDYLKSIYNNNFSGLVGINNSAVSVPNSINLFQNFPNPFNPVTSIKFDISKLGLVSLIIYDLLGREVSTLKNEIMHPGSYNINWDASSFPSGIYTYKLESSGTSVSKKMVLIK
jgi:hypothetical protein